MGTLKEQLSRAADGRNFPAREDIPLPDEPPDGDDHHVGEYSPNGHKPTEPADLDDHQAGEGDQGDPVENTIRQRMGVLRIDREARNRLDDETRPQILLPPIKTLTELLNEPDTPTRYRIEGLAPEGGRVLLSAQYKAGKTTIGGNVMRSLVDGDPFLGRFTVHTPAKRVVLIDNELSEEMLRRWLRDQHIENTAAVSVIALRGKVSTFNLLDDRCRDQWATRLRDIGTDYIVLDCLRPVLDALGLDENRDAGRFLVAFDALLADADVGDSLTVHHMGHANERARGDSRLQDWPDAIWRLMRETDEPESERYFSAYGRDVNVHEGRISFDPATRRYTYSQGSRIDAKVEAALRAVIAILAEDAKADGEGISGRAIETEAGGEHSRQSVRDAINQAIKHGRVVIEKGERRAKLHRIANPCDTCGLPVIGARSRHETCPSGPEGLFP
jgi:hypothetical protein